MAGAHPAAVFVVGDVAHVMESIFDAPVSSYEHHDGFGGSPLGRGVVRPWTVPCWTLPMVMKFR